MNVAVVKICCTHWADAKLICSWYDVKKSGGKVGLVLLVEESSMRTNNISCHLQIAMDTLCGSLIINNTMSSWLDNDCSFDWIQSPNEHAWMDNNLSRSCHRFTIKYHKDSFRVFLLQCHSHSHMAARFWPMLGLLNHMFGLSDGTDVSPVANIHILFAPDWPFVADAQTICY